MRTQAGRGPMRVFQGYPSHYGAGLGNVLSGLFRAAVPIVAPAVKNIGQSLLSAGANKLHNLLEAKLGPHVPRRTATTTPKPRVVRRKPVKRKAVGRRKTVSRKRRTKADVFGS